MIPVSSVRSALGCWVKEGSGLVVHIPSGCVAKINIRDRDRDRVCLHVCSHRINRMCFTKTETTKQTHLNGEVYAFEASCAVVMA